MRSSLIFTERISSRCARKEQQDKSVIKLTFGCNGSIFFMTGFVSLL